MTTPSVEDFFKKTVPGGSPIRDFLESLEPMVPTPVPEHLSRAATIAARRGALTHEARRSKIPVRTKFVDGQLWILRLEDQPDRNGV